MNVRSRRWAVRALAVVTVATAAPLIGAAAQAAITGTELRSTTLSIPGTSAASGSVACSAGRRVTGGGFGHQSGLANSVLVDTARPAGATSWIVRARNTTAISQQTNVSAVCSNQPSLTVRTTTVNLPPGGFAESTTTCPGGFNLGGGYALDQPMASSAMTIMWSRPALAGQGWNVRAANGTAAARQLTVYATCAPAIAGREVVTATQVVAPLTGSSVIASCPAGKVVTAGGWATGAFDRWLAYNSGPASTSSWTVRFHNSHPSITYGLVTYAVCATGT